jgi:hypothetical protein
LDGGDGYRDDYTLRNGRKGHHGSPGGSVRHEEMAPPRSEYKEPPVNPGPPLTPGGSIGRTQPLRRPNQGSRENSQRGRSEEPNTHFENLEAQEVMRREVYGT